MKRYSVELTADEIRLLRCGLITYQWYLDDYRNGIKPEVSDKCDDLIEKLRGVVKSQKGGSDE